MLKLQYKFIIAAVISAVLISAVVFENNKGSAIKLKQIETMKKITVIMQRHMQGDMMHEGIRGDVLGALYFASKDDIKGVESFKNDIDRHYKEFIENLDENLNAGLPNDVSSSVSETKRLVDLYGNKGKEIINRLISNTYYPDLYNEFNDLFEQLEILQEDTSGKIESWASNEKALVEKESGDLNNFILIISAISMFVAIFIAFYGRIAVFKPLSKVTNIMNELAGGSLNVDVPYLSRSDEIGNISKATQVFKENALAKVRMEQEQATLKLKMEEDKKKMMRQLADKFEQRVRGIIEAVAAASTELYHTSESMTSVISNANGKAGNVALASKEASGNVNSIASATEEMSASVREIVTQITKSSGVVKQAVIEVQKASETSNMLEKAANQIGEIVEMINNVAEQINLLALNATIESARAGEAGRGFAVVASEVKNLAGETTKSTEEISKHISSIQGISKQVIHTLKSIQDIVINVDEYSSAISAAAEEQNATTKEIAKNMGVIANSSSTINNDVEGVRVSIDEARTSSEQVLDAAKMLSQEAEKLNSEVSIFLKEIAA